MTGDEAEVDSRALQLIPHSVSRDPRSNGAALGGDFLEGVLKLGLEESGFD